MKKLLKDKKANPIGIIRKIDSLGRVVIPKEFRKKLGIENFDDIEMLLFDDNTILMQKEADHK